MPAASRKWGGSTKRKCFYWVYCALYTFVVVIVTSLDTSASVPSQSPQAKLEEMVMGAPLGDSSSTFDETDSIGEVQPEVVSKLSPVDRFRQIIESEYEDDVDSVPAESARMLHPVYCSRKRKTTSRSGALTKAALGLLPAAALFSQVLQGSRMRDMVLRRQPSGGFAEPRSFSEPDFVDSSTPIPLDLGEAKSTPSANAALGVMAGAAGAASLYYLKQAWNMWRRKRAVGLLASGTAKWDLHKCLLIVDVHGAEDAGALAGKYVPGSARVKVDLSTQRGTLTYSAIPFFVDAPLQRLRKKADRKVEQFDLPADHCFVRASSAEGKQSPGAPPQSFVQEYREKGRFRGERVAALVLHTAKAPGLERIQQSSAPPGEPPSDLIDTIRLSHEPSDESLVEVEPPPTSSGIAAASGGLDSVMRGDGLCGGTILCVESVSISNSKNLCTVHAAVEDTRSIAVLADIALQTFSIVVEENEENHSNGKTSPAAKAEFYIALPSHCALADVSDASYTVSPFTLDLGLVSDEEEATASTNTSDGIIQAVQDSPMSLQSDNRATGSRSSSAGEEGALAAENEHQDDASKSPQEGSNNEGAPAGEENGNRREVKFQHVRIQFRPLRTAELIVTLSSAPGKPLPR